MKLAHVIIAIIASLIVVVTIALLAIAPLRALSKIATHFAFQSRWITQSAAELGFADAQWALGESYILEKNYPEAFKWYGMAAKQKSAQGCDGLGMMYREGYGVPRDTKESCEWFSKALDYYRIDANNGDDVAQVTLGVRLYFGEDYADCTAKNYDEAFKWFKRAADQGNRKGAGWLSRMYSEGKGVQRNYQEAWFWNSIENRGVVCSDCWNLKAASSLTPEQSADVKKRLKEWNPHRE